MTKYKTPFRQSLRHKRIDRDLCRIVNYNISHNSRDFIFSSFKADFLDKFIEECIPYPFKFVSK